MPCTTILVGKKATYNGSTMVARTDDGFFDEKKLIVVTKDKQPKKYTSKIGHLTIELKDEPLSYTCSPSISDKNGIWAACGINELNVGMTATETITTNPRVLGADPYVRYIKKGKDHKEDIPGGIGEEDIVVLVLPYIKSAREGVFRLGYLLEKYGTYESNGIAFHDENEIWWLETIGGHHFVARRVEDDEYVMMPNQFGLDRFDFNDAFGRQEKNICSKDLLDFIKNNNLNLNQDDENNLRNIFGSRRDADHVYNTPRAWFMGRYFNPTDYKWDGPNADFNPESDNIPWSLVPERLITSEDIKYILSSYYQGTEYNPYQKRETLKKGMYRPIGVNRTGVTALTEIRNDVPTEIKAIEWVSFGANPFNAMIPQYTNVKKIPKYLSEVTLDCDTSNFYWTSRLIEALAESTHKETIQIIERYQETMFNESRRILNKYDKEFTITKDISLIDKANDELAKMAKKESQSVLNKVLLEASKVMKCGYNRADN